MAYSPRVVANALLRKAKEHGESLTHMKLQKLVFFVHGWGLAMQDRPIISEGVEAWPYGPVIDELYHELKHYGSRPVSEYLTEVDQNSGKVVALVPTLKDEAFWTLLDEVWAKYSGYSAMQLSDLTHLPGSPWHQSREAGVKDIPVESITKYFKEKLVAQHG